MPGTGILLARWKIFGSTYLELYRHDLSAMLEGLDRFGPAPATASAASDEPGEGLYLVTMRIITCP